MAITTGKTDLQAQLETVPPPFLARTVAGVSPLFFYPAHMQGAPGDVGSSVDLITLPPCRLLVLQCTVRAAAFGAGCLLSLGWRAYRSADGQSIAEDLDGLVVGLDVAAAGLKPWLAGIPGTGLDVNGGRRFDAPVVLCATVSGGPWPGSLKTYWQIAYSTL